VHGDGKVGHLILTSFLALTSRSLQIFRFSTFKSESLTHQRKNPRKIAWTVVFRRMHKKGITEEVAKKHARKNVKHQLRTVGAGESFNLPAPISSPVQSTRPSSRGTFPATCPARRRLVPVFRHPLPHYRVHLHLIAFPPSNRRARHICTIVALISAWCGRANPDRTLRVAFWPVPLHLVWLVGHSGGPAFMTPGRYTR